MHLRIALLCLSCVVLAPAAVAQKHESNAPMIAKDMATQKFSVFPGAPACSPASVERGVPEKESSIMIMKGSAGCTVPWHWHPSKEEIMLVSGTAKAEVKDQPPTTMRPGSFLSVPAHHTMRFACPSACILFLHTDGPFAIHYVDKDGKEISAEQALAAKSTRK